MVDFRREIEAAAQQDERVAVGFGNAKNVLDPADQHRIGLIHVELQVAQQHHGLRFRFGEHFVDDLQGIQRVGALGDPALSQIHQALGR